MKKRLGIILAAGVALGAAAADTAVFTGPFWKTDGFYGDGNEPSASYLKTPEKAPPGHRLSYEIDVPETGWYAPFFKGDPGDQDFFVDDACVAMARTLGKPGADGFAAGPSLWLEKGRRVLRLERLGRRGFPWKKFETMELRRLAPSAASWVFAEKAGHDVVRLGESVRIAVTAGLPDAAADYEIRVAPQNGPDAHTWTTLATLSFPKTAKPIRQVAELKLPKEAMYYVKAFVGGKPLPENAFPRFEAIAVDVNDHGRETADFELETVVDIDCVAQEPDLVANGPTQVTRRNGLAYRESHDCSKPSDGKPYDGNSPQNLSCFAYRVKVPEAQVPYVLEVTFPDDARRSACVRHDWMKEGTKEYLKANDGYQTKSYETGGFFPISGEMKRQLQIVWPLSTEGYVTLINQNAGTRAAAARIRLRRFKDDLPPSQAATCAGGRTFAYWSEEGNNFSIMLGAKQRPFLEAANRWYQMIRFYGGNAMSGCGIAYQGASWDARAWKGIGRTHGFSALRLFALLGEKYHMGFIPEWFSNQWFMDKVEYPLRAGGIENSSARNASGGLAGGGLNALCPAVQDVILATMREIHDEIGDSPAFKGLTVRADGWQFRGEFFFKSLYWGYNELNVRAFERETGVAVPAGTATDSFKFLTAPGVKEKWVAWRCAKIEDFHRRILAALRGDTRKDVFFGIAGQFDQERLYAKEKTYAERALGSGVDSVARRASDGFALIPCARFGSRIPNVENRAIYDEYFLKDSTDGGMGSPRAFASYMNYQELSTAWPAAKLGFDLKQRGGRPPYHCSAAVAAGRAALEKYAVVLAEQDSSYLREGGNADSFGSADVVGPWLARYESLPAVAFDRVPGANDPVAVWQKTAGGRLWYYAVNKESFATTATLTFSDGATRTVALEPWDLQVFDEPATRTVASATSVYPEAQQKRVRALLAYAQSVAPKAASADYDAALAAARDAAGAGKWWRARVTLDSAPMFAGYAAAGSIPGDVLRTPFPDKLDLQTPKNGHWNLCTPSLAAAALKPGASGAAKLVPSHEVNAAWNGDQVLWSETGDLSFVLDVPAEGNYTLVLGAVGAAKGEAAVSVNGAALPGACALAAANVPGTARFRGIALRPGKAEVRVKGAGALGVYGVRFLPEVRPIPGVDWAVAGPLEKVWGGKHGYDQKLLKAGFDDMMKKDLSTLDWAYAVPGISDGLADRGVQMPLRISSTGLDRLIVRTTVYSDRDRTATLISAVDWWSRATLNGERVKTDVVGGGSEENDLDFWGWYPMFTGVVNLKKGANDLVFYVNGGSLGSALTGWITDDPGITTKAPPKPSKTIVLQNAALRAEIVPAWGGRLMSFGTPTGPNAFWTDPAAATNTVDAKGRAVWKNVGGEKTWMGIESRWAAFTPNRKAWPPPAWFDSAPLDVVRANATNVLLRAPGFHTSGNWVVSLEREFTLLPDRLVVRERAVPPPDATPESLAAVTDDTRRVWSVTQIPFVEKVSVHTVGEGRTKLYDACPPLGKPRADGWADLDLSGVRKVARVTMDGDALAVDLPRVGRLVISQTAAPRHLATFGIPTRAIMFTTGGGCASPYIELEFVAQGPDAEQTLEFRLEGAAEAEAAAKAARLAEMNEDKLGMFVHWGIYSVPARGEWMMNKEKIPVAEYDKYAEKFCPPASFSPREWTKLAKKAGCRYAVLTTRHHDGFALFDTKTSDFNSVKTAAKRDFVREFVDACRADGLRVGFYFSIMNWQYDHSPNGKFDPAVWDEMVRTTHEALRELLTNYGKVDYLWYDGCSVPGSTDSEQMEKMWRIRELNAMARRLQPGIVINDRSSDPADFATPEQSLAAPPRGRAWESCMTCNANWGYVADDHDWKSGETLFRSLLHCARFGGNLLVNVGPRADGSIPEESVRALESLGASVAACPESIYGSTRDDWTEATHEAGVVTKAHGAYWLHTLKDEAADAPTPRLAHATEMTRVAPGVYKVAFEKGAEPCRWLGGRHDVEIKAGQAPVLGDSTDREAPPDGTVKLVDLPEATDYAFELPAGGQWRLEVGYVTSDGFKDTRTVVRDADAAGVERVALPKGAKGIYAVRQTPVWKAVAPKSWTVAGTFPSRFYETAYDAAAVDEVFARDLLAEAAKATFVPVGAENDRADKSDVRLNHNYADAEKRIGYSFARRNFRSDRAKTVYAAVGVDWWAEVYVNGRRVLPVSSGWKPKVFPLELRAGDNDVLVVTHGGSRQHWFTFYTNAAVEKFGAFEEFKPGAIKPKGHLESLLCRERDGMLGNRERLGYPFDTGLWSEPIRSIHFTEGVYEGEDEDVSGRKDWWNSGAWWPFEQTAYLLDAMARTATLVDAPKLAAEYRKSLDAVLKKQRAADGDLFVYFSRSTTQWPLVVFTRSAMAYADSTGDDRVASALARHYAGKKDVRTKWDDRDLSLEGMLWTAEKTGDRALVDDAVKCWDNSSVKRRFENETRIHEHGVSFSELLKMPALVYLYTGDEAALALGKRVLKNAFDLNEQASGQISCNEFLSGRDPRQGYESCVAADLPWTLGYYLQADGDVEAANHMERIVYNVLPGAITKDFCRHQYLSSANQVVCSPFGQSAHFNYGESAWRQYRPSHFPQCCTGNILRALPAFVQRMWMKDAKTGAPVAMLIGPCEVKGVYKGVGYTIAEETDYPFGDAVRFRVTVERPVEMPVRYRVPSWAERADAGSFATVTRTWKGTETFETTFPAAVKLHSDRNWHWFTRGALTLSYAVPGDVLVERPGDRFSPIRVEPSGDWNFAFDLAALKGRSFAAEPRPFRDPYSEPAFAVRVPVAEIREWQVLDGQRFMPDPPLYAHPTGKTREIELVPYATTLARVTCFPDVTPRRQLPVVAAYTPGECYPFDEKKPLSEQVFAPEHWTDKQFRSLYKVPQRGRDLYFDFINFFGYGKPQLAYALFRIWSDADGEATFCIGAANRWQAFIDGKEVANSGDGWVEAEMMAPTWVRHSVKKGYNYLLLKVASPGCRIGQFRREWGAKVEAFME